MGPSTIRRALLILLGLSTVLASCAPQTAAPSAGSAARSGGDTEVIVQKPTLLRLAIAQYPPSFGSRLGGFNGRVNQLINAFLARPDHRGELLPYLTEKLPSQDDGTWIVNPDGTMQTIWTLRPDARWHDGRPVTAEDVVFADRIYRDPELPVEPSGSSRSEPFISSVVARDAQTFEVNWKQPKLAAGRPTENDLVPLPRHLLEERYTSGEKQTFALNPFWTSEEYVGAGPFRVSKREPGVSFTLVANPDFFLGKPRIDTIEVRIMGDGNAIVAQLLADDLDFSEVITPEQATLLQERWKANHGGQIYTTLNKSTSVLFQQREVPNHQAALQDVRVRRALMHALDRETIAHVVTAGFSPPAHISLPPSYPLFQRMEQSAVKYPFNLRRTEELLNQAGWTRGRDGLYRNAAGGPFELEMYGSEPLELILVDYWRRAGISAAPTAMAASDAVSTVQGFEQQASFPGAAIDTKGPFLYGDTSVAQFPTEQNRWTGKNRSSWTEPQFEAILPRFERSLVQAERDDLAVELERILTSSVGMARVHYNPEPAAARSVVQGVKGKSLGQIPTYIWNITEWTV